MRHPIGVYIMEIYIKLIGIIERFDLFDFKIWVKKSQKVIKSKLYIQEMKYDIRCGWYQT